VTEVNKVVLWAVSILMVALMLGLAACPHAAAGELIKSDKPRDTTPDVNEAELATLVEGNSAFAFALYQELKEEDGNLFCSPYSLTLALVMTYAGARGETERQMADALHFILPQDRLHPAFNALALELDSRGQGAKGKDGGDFRLNIINAIWGQKGYEFLATYLDTLAINYGAGLRVLDFIGAPEESRATINQWASDQTEGRINNVLPEGSVNSFTRLIIANAIYFNAAWKYEFNENRTRDDPFYRLDGSESTVPMMRQTESFGYTEGDGYQAVELLYDGGELSMVIFLPQEGSFEAFEQALDLEQVNAIINTLRYREVALTMPRFEFDSDFNLRPSLESMGMPVAFSGDADFSGMTGGKDLFISGVIQKAFVSVAETGTEAAAVSGVIMVPTSMPEPPIEFNANRPFIFLIRDIETGAILFLGRILDPAA
jgi:serpin B